MSWLDASHIVGIWGSGKSNNIFTCDIGDASTVLIDLPFAPDDLVANGHGAVAIDYARDNVWPDTHYNFVVWHEGVISAVQDGFPESWSVDGSQLGVLHPFGRVRSPGGWVSVVSWPALHNEYSGGPPYATGYVHFDPSGRYAAFDTDSGAAPDNLLTRVVDLHSNAVTDIPRDDVYGRFAYWTPSGELAVVDQPASMSLYKPDGTMSSTAKLPLSAANASADGSTVAFWDGDGGSDSLETVRNGESRTLQSPSPVEQVFLSPDGSRIVVQTTDCSSICTDVPLVRTV